MACGTPVIAFNRGSVNELVGENLTGIKVNNENEMIEAINKLSIFRSHCRLTAEKKYDVEIIAKNYLNLF